MKIRLILTSFITLLSLFLSIGFAPYFADNSTAIPHSSISFLLCVVIFLFCCGSLVSLFLTIINHGVLRILINFVFSVIILSFLLPMGFSYLNMTVFSLNHKHIGYTGSAFIKSNTVCGNSLTIYNGFISSSDTDQRQVTQVTTKYIEVLCPIKNSPKNFIYHTDRVLAVSLSSKD